MPDLQQAFLEGVFGCAFVGAFESALDVVGEEVAVLVVPRGGMTSRSRLFSDGRVRVTLVSSGADRGLRIVTSRDLTIDVTLGYNIIRGTSCSGAKVQARVTAVGTRGPMVANMPIKPC